MSTALYMITALGFGACLMNAAIHYDKHRKVRWVALALAVVCLVGGMLTIYA